MSLEIHKNFVKVESKAKTDTVEEKIEPVKRKQERDTIVYLETDDRNIIDIIYIFGVNMIESEILILF